MKFILFIFFGFLSLNNFAQKDSTITKNALYIGGGRQGLTYIKYERLIFTHTWTQSVVNFGLGGIPGEFGYNEDRVIKIMPDFIQLFGFKWVHAELGIEPSFNFQGNFSYAELNGILGIRFQNRNSDVPSFFAHFGYNPKLYRTHKNDVEVPWYFGLGLNF